MSNNTTDYNRFYQLHYQTRPLVLANAWNAKSAQLIEQAGFQAIATSSGAIADSLGYKDGEVIPFSELLYMVKRITCCSGLPVTVDIERGYANDTDTLIDNIQQLIDLGVAGINLEDAGGEDLYLRKLSSIRQYLAKTGQKLFINARIDAFLLKVPSPLETTLRRVEMYEKAGANGLFVPAIQDEDLIREICSATALPVNVVGVSKLSSVQTLADYGVRRISMAVFLYKATYSRMSRILNEISSHDSLAPLHA